MKEMKWMMMVGAAICAFLFAATFTVTIKNLTFRNLGVSGLLLIMTLGALWRFTSSATPPQRKDQLIPAKD